MSTPTICTTAPSSLPRAYLVLAPTSSTMHFTILTNPPRHAFRYPLEDVLDAARK
ncbi:hypothetical protein M408DRAFT_26019 [Serendipita vermifera MAFF 305830]|uniref:Uncharacterized protein n=1 Tax=Serendipita vermifera MAFF 305830 TaxID=933852 RepID=A0A0C2WH33_SERVB|nr:hypothetical protein M408DRAFT_26019 [Serendipita vermifera MAFF 305830]